MAQEPAKQNTHDFLGLGPAPDEAAAKLGEPLYKDNCATCHGQNARGAQGPNLVRSPLVLHDEKGKDISEVVRSGRPQAGMPPFPDLTKDQIYDIAEYIHLQVELVANRGTYRQTYDQQRNQLTGDAEQGKAIFQRNCSTCHSTTGDLAHVGTKYPQASVMLARIAWPVTNQPKPAVVIASNGDRVNGALVKLDDFDVELRDADGNLHTWTRSTVKVELQDQLAGHRELLAKYTDADLHNLTAYLVSLK